MASELEIVPARLCLSVQAYASAGVGSAGGAALRVVPGYLCFMQFRASPSKASFSFKEV